MATTNPMSQTQKSG